MRNVCLAHQVTPIGWLRKLAGPHSPPLSRRCVVSISPRSAVGLISALLFSSKLQMILRLTTADKSGRSTWHAESIGCGHL